MLNRVQFENRGYVGPPSGNTPPTRRPRPELRDYGFQNGRGLDDLLRMMERKIGKFVDEHYDEIEGFIDDYMLELFVWIPWLENRIRSHRLSERDIKAMSRKGYKIFDGDKGRFVKELPPAVMARFKEW